MNYFYTQDCHVLIGVTCRCSGENIQIICTVNHIWEGDYMYIQLFLSSPPNQPPSPPFLPFSLLLSLFLFHTSLACSHTSLLFCFPPLCSFLFTRQKGLPHQRS